MTEELCTDKRHLNCIAQRAYTSLKNCSSSADNDELIQKYMPLVHKIARKVVTFLKPPLTFEDMISAGIVGLVMSARDFDPSHGAEFQTYAYIRIKGAILDELRGWTFTPANLHKRLQDARNASLKISQRTGLAPTDEQLADELDITIEELYELFEAGRAENFTSLDSFSPEGNSPENYITSEQADCPDEKAQREEMVQHLVKAIQQLPERNRHIILLYYQQHLTMKQISEIMEITESRVSQMHASALFNMSIKLRQWKDGIL